MLLEEAGKLYEMGPDLSDDQSDFREGRTTVDTVLHLRGLAKEAVSYGSVLLAVSLDIANEFSSLPFSCITKALNYHVVPEYPRRLVVAY